MILATAGSGDARRRNQRQDTFPLHAAAYPSKTLSTETSWRSSRRTASSTAPSAKSVERP